MELQQEMVAAAGCEKEGWSVLEPDVLSLSLVCQGRQSLNTTWSVRHTAQGDIPFVTVHETVREKQSF